MGEALLAGDLKLIRCRRAVCGLVDAGHICTRTRGGQGCGLTTGIRLDETTGRDVDQYRTVRDFCEFGASY